MFESGFAEKEKEETPFNLMSGARMNTSDWLYRNCVYADWGAMVVTVVVGLGLLAASVFGASEIKSEFWRFAVRWLCGPVGALFLVVAITEMIRIVSFCG